MGSHDGVAKAVRQKGGIGATEAQAGGIGMARKAMAQQRQGSMERGVVGRWEGK
jgi:hypothetical protein